MAKVSEVIKSMNAVYIVMTKVPDKHIIGGGVCVNRNGLIITTAMLIPAQHEGVSVRSRDFTGFRPARVLHVDTVFGIAFLVIDDIEEDEVFNCIDLEDDLSIEEGDGLFSWIHHDKIVFSLISGKASFPFQSAVFPSFASRDTVGTTNDDALFELRAEEYSETFSFRTIGGIIETKPDKLEISSLHPRLPVIEVHGFLCNEGYGSPVFDMGGRFVGLIMLRHSEMNYILPSNMIKPYMRQNPTFRGCGDDGVLRDFDWGYEGGSIDLTGSTSQDVHFVDRHVLGVTPGMLTPREIIAEGEMTRQADGLRDMARSSEYIKELDVVYVILTEVSKDLSITGNGVCISRDGLIITTAMVAPADHTGIEVRSRNSNGFRRAKVLDVNSPFDITVLVIEPTEEDEIFEFFDLGDDFPIEEGDPLFSWIHTTDIVFSLITGKVSFPFDSVVFPRLTSKKTIGSALMHELVHFRENSFLQTLSFRTTGGIVEDKPDGQKKLSHLHPRLPVIEVHGFLCDNESYGSPVFDRGGRFVGLIMLQHCEMNYVLPSNMIKPYIEENLKKFRMLMKIKGTEPAASSQGGAGSSRHKKGKDKKPRKDRIPHFPGGGHAGVSSNVDLVCGGCSYGLMDSTSQDVHLADRHVFGVIPEMLTPRQFTAEGEMDRHSDGFPGGYGTHAEHVQVMMNAQFGIHDEPVELPYVDGYYNYVLSFIDKAVEEGLISPDIRDYILSMSTAEQMVKELGEYVQLED